MQDENLRKIAYKSHFWRYMNALLGTIAVIVGLVYVFFEDIDKTAGVGRNICNLFGDWCVTDKPPGPSHGDSRPRGPGTSALVPDLDLATVAKQYRPGARFDYGFEASHDGYASLWNITASGGVQRILPLATNRRALRVVGGQRYATEQGGLPALTVSGDAGLEQLLLLWCPELDNHGYGALFTRGQAFERDLEARRESGCFERRASYRVLVGPGVSGAPG